MTQRHKLGHKLYEVWPDSTGFDFSGHPKDNLPLPPAPCPPHSPFRISKLLGLPVWNLEDVGLEPVGRCLSAMAALCPLSEHLSLWRPVLQTPLKDPPLGLILGLELGGLSNSSTLTLAHVWCWPFQNSCWTSWLACFLHFLYVSPPSSWVMSSKSPSCSVQSPSAPTDSTAAPRTTFSAFRRTQFSGMLPYFSPCSSCSP